MLHSSSAFTFSCTDKTCLRRSAHDRNFLKQIEHGLSFFANDELAWHDASDWIWNWILHRSVCKSREFQLQMNSFGVTLQFSFGGEHFCANFAVDEFHLVVDPLNVEQKCIFSWTCATWRSSLDFLSYAYSFSHMEHFWPFKLPWTYLMWTFRSHVLTNVLSQIEHFRVFFTTFDIFVGLIFFWHKLEGKKFNPSWFFKQLIIIIIKHVNKFLLLFSIRRVQNLILENQCFTVFRNKEKPKKQYGCF